MKKSDALTTTQISLTLPNAWLPELDKLVESKRKKTGASSRQDVIRSILGSCLVKELKP